MRFKMRWFAFIALVVAATACSPRNTNWDRLGNSSEMQHHSELTQINRQTIGELELAWWVEMPTQAGLVGNPLIKDGVVFQGGPAGQIFANDIRTGRQIWTFAPEPRLEGATFAGYISRQFNRGLALWDDKVIIAADCRLYAVSQRSGELVWEAEACDATQVYGITAAPRVGQGLVFTGNNCMDSGMSRGHVDAFDANTGEHRWRFYTVPGDPSQPQDSALYEMAERTWGTDWHSRSRGCASAWDAITYDPELRQVIIGTGGPAPVRPSDRAPDAGDELFTNSIVALDAETGEYRWHFKQVPHDGWNFDSSVGIMIADLQINGATRRTVLSVPKNGFAYVLDARTGEFISGRNYVDVNWTQGLDERGRPIPEPSAEYWTSRAGGMVVLPSTMGAHGWEALAFDPESSTLYIPAMNIPTYIGRSPTTSNMGIVMDFTAGDRPGATMRPYGEVVAWDPVAGVERWRTRASMPINGGLLHTAGGVVFQGMADGRFVAFDAATGEELWSRQTGGAIRGAPSTVMVDGQQYLIVATGNGAASATGSYLSRYNSTPESRTPPRLLAFRLGGTSAYPQLMEPPTIAAPSTPRQDAALAARGEPMFEGYTCAACHGFQGAAVGGPVPNLNIAPPPDFAFFQSVVQQGALAERGMPGFEDMSDADARAIFAYIINEAWNAHDEQRRDEAR